MLSNIYLLEKEILASLINTLDINSFGYIQYSLYRLCYVVYDHHHNGTVIIHFRDIELVILYLND